MWEGRGLQWMLLVEDCVTTRYMGLRKSLKRNWKWMWLVPHMAGAWSFPALSLGSILGKNGAKGHRVVLGLVHGRTTLNPSNDSHGSLSAQQQPLNLFKPIPETTLLYKPSIPITMLASQFRNSLGNLLANGWMTEMHISGNILPFSDLRLTREVEPKRWTKIREWLGCGVFFFWLGLQNDGSVQRKPRKMSNKQFLNQCWILVDFFQLTSLHHRFNCKVPWSGGNEICSSCRWSSFQQNHRDLVGITLSLVKNWEAGGFLKELCVFTWFHWCHRFQVAKCS